MGLTSEKNAAFSESNLLFDAPIGRNRTGFRSGAEALADTQAGLLGMSSPSAELQDMSSTDVNFGCGRKPHPRRGRA